MNAYELYSPRMLWEDVTDFWFFSWNRFGSYVLMSAELELAAWNINGEKLWSTYVEPPWTYSVENDSVQLDVMGRQSTFSLLRGQKN